MPRLPRRSADLQLIERVSRANLERDIRHLTTAWPTRHTLSRHSAEAAKWIADRLRRLGMKPVLDPYQLPSRNAPGGKARCLNVVGELAAIRKGARISLVCAHFDSRQQNLGDPDAPAPGAGDNASGVAALLECARLLAAHAEPRRDTLRFVFFSGEEQGLLGSQAYARKASNRDGLRLVFNVDQIGYPPPDRALYVDRDESGRPENNAASAAMVETVRKLAADVVKVPTRVDPAEGSDYISFERYGVPILGLYEAGQHYPHYHRDTDTIDHVDLRYVQDMTRLALASILELCREG